jgi:predicted HicB family RNase H-like nuclease
MKYKGYEGAVVFDDEAGIFHGEVLNTRDVITFQGTSVDELKKAFEDSVDDYLAFCEQRGEEPEKPFSGNLVIRINPALHRELSIEAKKTGKSLNNLIEQKLSNSRSKEDEERLRA